MPTITFQYKQPIESSKVAVVRTVGIFSQTIHYNLQPLGPASTSTARTPPQTTPLTVAVMFSSAANIAHTTRKFNSTTYHACLHPYTVVAILSQICRIWKTRHIVIPQKSG